MNILHFWALGKKMIDVQNLDRKIKCGVFGNARKWVSFVLLMLFIPSDDAKQ